MTTTSYPIVGTNIDHAQWMQLHSRPAGFFDPEHVGWFSITLSSTDDTATIGVGKYQFRGFAIRVTAAHALTLAAAVGSAKTYTIGIMYDPAKEADPAGPLYLAAPVKTAITVPSGGDFCPLWDVTRQPSQVLSQAAIVDRRLWQYPLAFANANRPAPTDFSFGQVLITTGYPSGVGMLDIHLRSGSTAGSEAWTSLLSPSWQNMALATGLVVPYVSVPPQYARVAGRMELQGAIGRSGGTKFVAGTEYTVGSFSAALAPIQNRRLVVACVGAIAFARVMVYAYNSPTPGRVTLIPSVDCDSIHLDGIYWYPKGA
ncbi:MAG: hypothetical protein ACTHQ3_15745 [Motilibacteraceae bacterium]